VKLTCPNKHIAVVRHDPNSTGFLAMCDTCGWTAPKIKVEWERAQKEEQERRQLKAGEREREEQPQLEARRRAD
jgi:hypothetical protein